MNKGHIRKARIDDAGEIHKLINQFAAQELMLARALSEIYELLRDFLVYEYNQRVIACCALHISWKELAEIRSLAVSPRYKKRGIARGLICAAIKEAKSLGCKSTFVLTYIPGFFSKFGFRRVSKARLPHKIWADCVKCAKFPDCKEVAMIKKL